MDYDLSDETDLSVQAAAYIKKKEGRFFKAGGLWIYDNEVDRVEGSFEDGDILSVRDFDGYFLGYGFINRRSTIRIRTSGCPAPGHTTTAPMYPCSLALLGLELTCASAR